MIKTKTKTKTKAKAKTNTETESTQCSRRARVFLAPVVVLVALMTTAGCGTPSGDETEQVGLGAESALPNRQGSVVVDGCVMDVWQRSTLASAGAKRVLRGGEVILLCLVPREDGTVGPRDPGARAALAALTGELKKDGYRVHFGLSFTDESGQRYDGSQTRAWLADPAWRARVRDSLTLVLEPADGLEIDMLELPNDARPFVTALVAELAQRVRPAKRLNIFVPPSVSVPSDLPGGDAFSRRDLAPNVDRMRIMTLDFSDKGPGPTMDPGWAVDAVRLARGDFARVDISYPLYGTDFGPRGRRSIGYLEGRAVATIANAPIEHGPTGAPFVRYISFGNEAHQLWFDDAESTGRALGAWNAEVLPLDVGVLFYGLGAEDPALFDRIGARMP